MILSSTGRKKAGAKPIPPDATTSTNQEYGFPGSNTIIEGRSLTRSERVAHNARCPDVRRAKTDSPMKIKFRSLITVLLFALTAGLLAGCASSQPKSGSAADHPQAVPSGSTMH